MLLALGTWLLPSCDDTETFQCAQSSQCNVNGATGTCELSGYCSFDDPDCESGRRYGDFAGALSGFCVEDEPTTTSTSSDGDGPSCSSGTLGCGCDDNGACEAGASCQEGACVPEGCDAGTEDCTCIDGECLGSLICNVNAVCSPPSSDDGGDEPSGGTSEPDSCEPSSAADDCNGNGVADACDQIPGGATCVLSGYVEDADDVAPDLLNGDIRMAFVRADGDDLVLGMGFHDPLQLGDGSSLFEIWWYFDADNNPDTGSEQVGQFGGEIDIRVNIASDGSQELRVNDEVVVGNSTLEDGNRLVVIRLKAPKVLKGLPGGRWVGVSGGVGENFQADTDKTPIAGISTPAPTAEDCNGDGLFDACQPQLADEIGNGLGIGDGVPDICQADVNGDGVDDTCRGFG